MWQVIVLACDFLSHPHFAGQSGPFKMAEITHFNICSVMAQLFSTWRYYESDRDIVLGALPPDGVFGSVGLVFWSLCAGVPFVLLPKFDPKTWLSCIETYKITVRTSKESKCTLNLGATNRLPSSPHHFSPSCRGTHSSRSTTSQACGSYPSGLHHTTPPHSPSPERASPR